MPVYNQLSALALLPAAALALLPSSLVGQSTYADITDPVDVQLGAAVSLLGDIYGDGYADFAVSTFFSVGIYSGRTGVLMTNLPGVAWAARAGDIDGDTIPDVLVKPQFSADVQVLRGRFWNVLHTFSLPNNPGSLAALGDVDGDGVDDVGMSSNNACYVFSGQTKAQIFSAPGGRIAAVGDVTGDGVADFATQTSTATTLHALVGPAVSFPPIARVWAVNAGLSCCAGVGDVDGDTVPDFATGESYGSPNGLNRAGEVFVYSGATGALLRRIAGGAPNTRLGRDIAAFGDLNGDGYPEALVATTAYRADVLDLATGAVVTSIIGLGHQYNEVDAGLDITGDGIPDGIIGAPQPVTNSPGFARLVSGATLTLQTDRIHLPAATGGAVQMNLDLGPSHAGAVYIVVGSLTEPVVGFSLGGVHIPVNRDFYFASLVGNPNQFISGSLGNLDANGQAQAVLTAAPGFIPSAFVGTVARHCGVLLPGTGPLDVTNTMPLTVR